MRDEVEAVIELMRPAIQADGGDIVLHGVDEVTGVVTLELPGGCNTCGSVARTSLEAGVDRILRERVPTVREIRYAACEDATCDHPGSSCDHAGDSCDHP